MQPCPNCGELVDTDKTMCPNCGRSLTPSPVPDSDIWPPPPEGVVAPQPVPPPVGRLVTGHAWVDYGLGFLLGVLAWGFYGVGLLVVPLVYALMRRSFPYFARGMGLTGLLVLVVFLGALGFCLYRYGGRH